MDIRSHDQHIFVVLVNSRKNSESVGGVRVRFRKDRFQKLLSSPLKEQAGEAEGEGWRINVLLERGKKVYFKYEYTLHHPKICSQLLLFINSLLVLQLKSSQSSSKRP